LRLVAVDFADGAGAQRRRTSPWWSSSRLAAGKTFEDFPTSVPVGHPMFDYFLVGQGAQYRACGS